MFCPNCGREIPDGTKFCPYCGGACSAGAAAAPQPQPQDYGYVGQQGQTPDYGYYNQQGAAQGYQGYQAPAPKKSNKKLLLIIIIAAAVVLIGFLVWFFFLRGGSGGGSSPEKTLENFEDALNDLDVEAMLACMDSKTRAEVAKYGIGMDVSAMSGVMKAMGISFDLETVGVNYTSPTVCEATVAMTYSIFGVSKSDTGKATLVLEADGNWYIDGDNFDVLDDLDDILG